jgi:hypothetical protein
MRETMGETNEKTRETEYHLERCIQNHLGSRVRHLRVICTADGIILQGKAPTYHTKQLAQHVVMEIAKLSVVANEIEVS